MLARDKARQSSAGFTLIELLIVLSVIGLVAAIAAPRIDMQRYRVQSAMLGVGTTLVGAQRLAVTRQHDVIVTFDVGAGMLYIHSDQDNNGQFSAGEPRRGQPVGEGVVYGRGPAPARPMGPGPVTFTHVNGGLPSLTFHRNGSASEAAGLYLTSARAQAMMSRPQDARAIEIERSTGRVSWYKYGAPAWRRGF